MIAIGIAVLINPLICASVLSVCVYVCTCMAVSRKGLQVEAKEWSGLRWRSLQ